MRGLPFAKYTKCRFSFVGTDGALPVTTEGFGNPHGVIQKPLPGMVADPQIPALVPLFHHLHGWQRHHGLPAIAGDLGQQAQALSSRVHVLVIPFAATEVDISFAQMRFLGNACRADFATAADSAVWPG